MNNDLFLQAGWVRAISAGEDNSACISCWSFTGFTASLFEVAAAERRFYSFLNCILSSVVHPLKESSKGCHSLKAQTEIDL